MRRCFYDGEKQRANADALFTYYVVLVNKLAGGDSFVNVESANNTILFWLICLKVGSFGHFCVEIEPLCRFEGFQSSVDVRYT